MAIFIAATLLIAQEKYFGNKKPAQTTVSYLDDSEEVMLREQLWGFAMKPLGNNNTMYDILSTAEKNNAQTKQIFEAEAKKFLEENMKDYSFSEIKLLRWESQHPTGQPIIGYSASNGNLGGSTIFYSIPVYPDKRLFFQVWKEGWG